MYKLEIWILSFLHGIQKLRYMINDDSWYKNSKRDFYQDVYTILNRIKFDMDHMRISGTEPSSVILSQTK